MIINVLLRGRSLSEFNTLGPADIVFLANDMDREVEEVNGFREYLSDKEINLVFNMAAGADSGYHAIGFFETFNVTKLIRPYIADGTQPDSSRQNINLPDEFLSERHKPFMYRGDKYPYEYPGTGIAGVACAMLDYNSDVVNIVGLDFYDNLYYGETNYLVKDNAGRDFWTDLGEIKAEFLTDTAVYHKNDPKTAKELREASRLSIPELDDWQYKIQNTLCDLVEYKPNIQVNLKTKCKVLIDRMRTIDNLNITEVE